ncbi:hypothetical protein MKJ04_05925 [Pontibacter sp. E15-1]|uniref:hypothetical protein n=1 Tax=Pontibacter sp. E15-1 TaxID=2919918 RepID=UPI001F4F488C|nr:hypothetical protein [Pontibacter sp. E15-1]MCJ8164375.1 hypothetical protein [Pontibacter sp. E15-1]
MKRFAFFVAAVAVWGFSTPEAMAQAGQTPVQQGQKEKVTQEQLPEPVQHTLKSDTYQAWTIGDIYKVSAADEAGKAVYEVTMTNAQGQTGVVRLNEKGADASERTEK